MTTPHQIGQVAKAEILVAHLIEHDTDHERCAKTVVAGLLDAGWTAPRDLTVPALRPVRVATDGERRKALTSIMADVENARRKVTTVSPVRLSESAQDGAAGLSGGVGQESDGTGRMTATKESA